MDADIKDSVPDCNVYRDKINEFSNIIDFEVIEKSITSLKKDVIDNLNDTEKMLKRSHIAVNISGKNISSMNTITRRTLFERVCKEICSQLLERNYDVICKDFYCPYYTACYESGDVIEISLYISNGVYDFVLQNIDLSDRYCYRVYANGRIMKNI